MQWIFLGLLPQRWSTIVNCYKWKNNKSLSLCGLRSAGPNTFMFILINIYAYLTLLFCNVLFIHLYLYSHRCKSFLLIFLLLIVTNRVRANLIRVAEGLLHTQRRANIMSRGLFSFRNSFSFAIVLFVVWPALYVAKFGYVLMQSTLIASDVSCLFVCVS